MCSLKTKSKFIVYWKHMQPEKRYNASQATMNLNLMLARKQKSPPVCLQQKRNTHAKQTATAGCLSIFISCVIIAQR